MNEKQTNHWSLKCVAEKLDELEAQVRLKPETSQRQLAEELGIPRTTLQHWIKRKEEI
ncbi:MAG: helix-turn-helix domain-containing protein, partial [Ardenticatenaceae bacterium]